MQKYIYIYLCFLVFSFKFLGSSFPKAKPKQSLLTVIRLAILRYLFLPIYAKWWVGHTSFKLYFLFLLIYIGQMFNWAIYMNHIHKIVENTEVSKSKKINK